MPFRTLLLDTDDVLYTHPKPDRHLQDYLAAYDLQPRHPKVVRKALKAAYFDVLHGRISRQEYYDAILSFHGLPQNAIEYGRSVLLADAAAIQPVADAVNTLLQLQDNGVGIAIAANTEHPADDLVTWLEDVGFPRDLWWMVMTSCEIGLTKPDPAYFRVALQSSSIPPDEMLYVGGDFYELSLVGEQGIMPVAFQPDNPENIGGSNIIHSYQELYQMVMG